MNIKESKFIIRIVTFLCIALLALFYLPEPVNAMGNVKQKVSKFKQKKSSKKSRSGKKDTLVVEETQSTKNAISSKHPVYYMPPGTDPYKEPVDLSEEDIEEQRRFHKLIEQKQYTKSYEVIQTIPEGGLTKKERAMKKDLK
ncbi:hypothetical protein DID80_08555, partial [Candidatus Marinamargulisbacteria bacterium SCGC AAA071-K20]